MAPLGVLQPGFSDFRLSDRVREPEKGAFEPDGGARERQRPSSPEMLRLAPESIHPTRQAVSPPAPRRAGLPTRTRVPDRDSARPRSQHLRRAVGPWTALPGGGVPHEFGLRATDAQRPRATAMPVPARRQSAAKPPETYPRPHQAQHPEMFYAEHRREHQRNERERLAQRRSRLRLNPGLAGCSSLLSHVRHLHERYVATRLPITNVCTSVSFLGLHV